MESKLFSYPDDESGYGSGSANDANTPEVFFTKAHLDFLNRRLGDMEPQEILRWCTTSLPKLYQTTAFGLTGLVTLDMLANLNLPGSQQVELVFLDTLYHFPETMRLLDRIRERYPQIQIHTYKPQGVSTAKEFEDLYGQRLWEAAGDRYDWLAKVEPAERAYRELGVSAVLTGRRRSQGGKRGDLGIIEVDQAGLIKVNPLANWSFEQVREYIRAHDVPYNELLDRGYKSVGDWHSTQPTKDGEDERAGRWKGQQKTECGIHNPKSRYAQYLREQEMKRKESSAMDSLQVSASA